MASVVPPPRPQAPTGRPVRLAILGLAWAVAYVMLFGLALHQEDWAWPRSHSQAVLSHPFMVMGLGALGGYALEVSQARGHNELGLIPFGSLGLTLLAFVGGALLVPGDGASSVTQASPGFQGLIALVGAFLAWFVVPLFRFLRDRPGQPSRGVRLAHAAGAAVAMSLVAVACHAGLERAGLERGHLLIVLGFINAAVALFIYRLLPEFLLRFLAWLLVRGLYRLEWSGAGHIPSEGPALIVCNHVSFVDALVIMAACTRPIRFVMDHRIFRTPVLGFVFREGRAIPIAPAREDTALLERAYDEVAQALGAGELVGIFPEGGLTRDGKLQPFRGGIARIVERTPVPVVPMALAGLWGGVFSRRHSGWRRWIPGGVLPRIRLTAGPAIAPEGLEPDQVRAEVESLLSEGVC